MLTLRTMIIMADWLLCVGISAGNTGAKMWWENIEGRISVGKPEFLVGEPVFVKVTISNQSGKTIQISDTLYRSFQFSVQGSSGGLREKAENPEISGLFQIVSIPNEGTFEDVAFLSNYGDFPKPGVYAVRCHGSVLISTGSAEDGTITTHNLPVLGSVPITLRDGSRDDLARVLRDHAKQFQIGDRRGQRQAAYALARSEPNLAVTLLREAIGGNAPTDPVAVTYGAWALLKIGTDAAIRALSDVALRSPDEKKRIPVAIELGKSRVAPAVSILTEMLSDQSPSVRVAALNALGAVGDTTSIPAVEARLGDPDIRVRGVAGQVLQNLSSKRGPRSLYQKGARDRP